MKRQLGTLAVAITAFVVLAACGRGMLAPPPLTTFHALWLWWVERGPIVGTVAILRLIALGGAAYLAAAATATLMATLTRWRWMSRLVMRMLVPGTRWLLRGGVTLSLAVAPAPRLAARPAPGTSAVTVPVLRRIDPEPGRTSATPAGIAHVPPGDGAIASHRLAATALVRQGDSFWSISRDVLGAAWSRQPSDREVGPLWVAMIRLNRARLPRPGDPDLLLPGMAVEIPDPGVAP